MHIPWVSAGRQTFYSPAYGHPRHAPLLHSRRTIVPWARLGPWESGQLLLTREAFLLEQPLRVDHCTKLSFHKLVMLEDQQDLQA